MSENLIFTISYKRPSFLKLSMASILSHIYDATYVVWDNASDDETKNIFERTTNLFQKDSVETIYHPSKNIGLNAASAVVETYRTTQTKYIMSIDEDILMLPLNFQSELQALLSAGVGYAALDVFQDKTTNGAKPPAHFYKQNQINTALGTRTLLEGPTGGWASMFTAKTYDIAGGYPTRDEIFFGIDGIFTEKIRIAKQKTGILEGVCCYHATGNMWNEYFGFSDVLNKKLTSYEEWIAKGSP